MVKTIFLLIFDYLKADYFEEKKLDTVNAEIFSYHKVKKEKEKHLYHNNILTLTERKTLTKNASPKSVYDYRMTVFTSKMGNSFLAFGTHDFSLILYNIILFSISYKVSNAHTDNITLCRHYYDKMYDRDLIMTTSYDYSVKVWKLVANKELNNIMVLSNVGLDHGLLSCMILNEAQYILTCSIYHVFCVWNSKGQLLRENKTVNFLFFIDTWQDPKNGEHYVIIGNDSDVTSYTFNDLNIYKKYSDGKVSNHFSARVNDKGLLYETDRKGDLRIWNFHTGDLIRKIENNVELNGVCLWNDQFVLAGGAFGKLILFDLKDEGVKKIIAINESFVRTVISFIHPIYGASVFTYSSNGTINMIFSI